MRFIANQDIRWPDQAQVKVLIEATDGDARWDAGCVSTNIVDASFEALCSTAIMGIFRTRNAARRSA